MSAAFNKKAVYKLPDEPADRLEAHLDNWTRWMKSDVLTDGYRNRSTGFIAGGYSAEFEDLMDAADIRCAMAVDALIRSLEAPQQAAIHHAYLRAVFRFPRASLENLLERAKAALRLGMDARGIY